MTEQLIHTHPQARDDRHCLAVQPLLRENHFICTGFWTGSLDGWFYFAPRGNALAPLGGEDWEGAPEPWVVNPAEPGWDLGPFAAMPAAGHTSYRASKYRETVWLS